MTLPVAELIWLLAHGFWPAGLYRPKRRTVASGQLLFLKSSFVLPHRCHYAFSSLELCLACLHHYSWGLGRPPVLKPSSTGSKLFWSFIRIMSF
jgi:hypothetical protein